MTRKRYIRTLMSIGLPRNVAYRAACRDVAKYGSYQKAFDAQKIYFRRWWNEVMFIRCFPKVKFDSFPKILN